MKCTFHGYYGFKNSGDDSFIEVSAWGANKYWQSQKNIFLSQRIPKTISDVSFIGKPRFYGHNLLKSIGAILRTNAFITSGGSVFNDVLAFNDPRIVAKEIRKFKKDFIIGAIGVSIGPYRSKKAEIFLIKYLQQLDFLVLRDKKSYLKALSYDLPYKPVEGFDLAALLPEVYENNKLLNKDTSTEEKPTKVIGVSICNYERYVGGDTVNENRRNQKIFKLLEKIALSDKEAVFRFFIFNGNAIVGDEEITYNIIKKLKSKTNNRIELINYNYEVFKTWQDIKQCNVILSTRLHASIFACFAGIPFFLVEYHRKCSDFLDTIGYQNNYRLYDADFEINKISNLIIDIINKNHLFEEPSNINQALKMSKRNFTHVQSLLNY